MAAAISHMGMKASVVKDFCSCLTCLGRKLRGFIKLKLLLIAIASITTVPGTLLAAPAPWTLDAAYDCSPSVVRAIKDDTKFSWYSPKGLVFWAEARVATQNGDTVCAQETSPNPHNYNEAEYTALRAAIAEAQTRNENSVSSADAEAIPLSDMGRGRTINVRTDDIEQGKPVEKPNKLDQLQIESRPAPLPERSVVKQSNSLQNSLPQMSVDNSQILWQYDDRVLANATGFPGRTIAYTQSVYNNTPAGEYFRCTGTLIAPNLMLTAGHCIFGAGSNGTNELPSSLDVYPGQYTSGGSGVRPYGTRHAVSYWYSSFFKSSFNAATELISRDLSQYDIAAVVLNSPFNLSSFLPVAYSDVYSGTNSQGYPAYVRNQLVVDQYFNWTSSTAFTNGFVSQYFLFSTGGNSGGPLWVQRNDASIWIVGSVSAGNETKVPIYMVGPHYEPTIGGGIIQAALADAASRLIPPVTLSVSLVGTGSGAVISSPSGISCGSACSANFNSGSSVVLTATPANGSTFAGWGGACPGTGLSVTVTFTVNTSCTANFVVIQQTALSGYTSANYGSSNSISISGTSTYQFNPTTNTVLLGVSQISNASTTRPSAALRLSLWALSAPAGGGSITGKRLAAYSFSSTLQPGYIFNPFQVSTSYTMPPDGTYYLTLFVDEYTNCAGSTDGYCYDSYANFPNPIYIQNGSFVSAITTPVITVTAPTRASPATTPSGGTVSVSAAASYNVPGSLSYLWLSDCGVGNSPGPFLNARVASTTWNAPINNSGAPFTCKLTVTISGSAGGQDVNSSVTVSVSPAIIPQTGWWWNPNDVAGRGYSLEVNNGRILMAAYMYRDDGTPVWYLADEIFSNGGFTGTVFDVQGTQTLNATGPGKTSMGPTSIKVSGTFSSANQGIITLTDSRFAGGTTSIPITRFPIDSVSIKAPTTAVAPQTGWWWNTNEPGVGYFIEQQGSQIFYANYLYGDDQRDQWFISLNSVIPSGTSGVAMTGSLLKVTGGQTLTSGAKTGAATTAGQVTLQFTSSTSGTVTLPSGRVVQLSRFTAF